MNGRRITVAQELWNGDRILFGSNHYFQVIFPARSREEGCTALVSHSEALRERDAWKSQYDNLSRMSMLNQKLLGACMVDDIVFIGREYFTCTYMYP